MTRNKTRRPPTLADALQNHYDRPPAASAQEQLDALVADLNQAAFGDTHSAAQWRDKTAGGKS